MSDENNVASGVNLGDFPYPLPKGSEESQYLTWLRNHSNYMVTRGFWDYFRLAGVLVRGILINFLIFLSLLLVVSVVINHLYGPQLSTLAIKQSDLNVSGFASMLELNEPVNKWLAKNLSLDTKAALADLTEKEAALKDLTEKKSALKLQLEVTAAESKLSLALVNDIRDLIDGEWILPKVEEERVKEEVKKGQHNQKKPEDLRLLVDERVKEVEKQLVGRLAKNKKEKGTETPTWWANRMKTLSDGSRSQLRRLNRQFLKDAYPAGFQLPDLKDAGLFDETVTMPPMPVPFTLTHGILLIALAWILISPIAVRLREIAGHKKSTERAGSDNSTIGRDWFERTFGFALLSILVVGLFEVLPVLVDKFHQFRGSPEMNWNAIFASLAGVSVAVVGGASKLLSVLGGAKKKLAMLLIGLLGVLLPLLVFLYVTDFLVYSDVDVSSLLFLVVVPLPLVFFFGILWGMFVGWRNESFSASEWPLLVLLLLAVIIGTIAIVLFLAFVAGPEHINTYLVLILAAELGLFCRLVVDVNRTSIHGLYRDRLASAYLVGLDSKRDVAIEEDINLGEIGCHEAKSTAPYHLVNVTLNLQGSKDMSVRDRNSDFFIFSKRFIGGKRTGYCRTETLEQVHPQMSLATAMAISAAAASPNMGRGTNPMLVAFMVLLNIRLGYWLPNPGRLEDELADSLWTRIRKKVSSLRSWSETNQKATKQAPGFSFEEVFEQELVEIKSRWDNIYPDASDRKQRHLYPTDTNHSTTPMTDHALVGLGFSGGGIRSATINLGIAQVLHERGIFKHVDYMSTVSGGGYLGSSISTLMRRYETQSVGEVAGKPSFHTSPRKHHSEIEGEVSLVTNAMGETTIVTVKGRSAPGEQREYRISRFDRLVVENGDAVKAGQELIERHDSLWDRFRWRVRPFALVREMMMKLDETHKWVNLSDGGHIENLAGIELLRRRCKFIIIGDGEADPELSFNGLATLIRYARIDLGITIDIDPDAIRINKSQDAIDKGTDNLSREHWAFGTITYPEDKVKGLKREEGYLLYLKSSYTGDEDEVIKEYRYRNPTFPHQSTADQFFDENQFECYRALGQHIAETALSHAKTPPKDLPFALADLEPWFEALNSASIARTARLRAAFAIRRNALEGYSEIPPSPAEDSHD